MFRPWVTHTPPSAGKDLTGGPGPGPHAPGFLCPQQRPENSLGHDRHVRRARGLCEELQGLLWGSRGLTPPAPPACAHEGACGAGQAWPRFCSSACYPWVGSKSPKSSEPHVSALCFLCLSVHGGALRHTPLPDSLPCHLSLSQVPQMSPNLSHPPRTPRILLGTNAPCALKPASPSSLKPMSCAGF